MSTREMKSLMLPSLSLALEINLSINDPSKFNVEFLVRELVVAFWLKVGVRTTFHA